jgi:hypothetical protein
MAEIAGGVLVQHRVVADGRKNLEVVVHCCGLPEWESGECVREWENRNSETLIPNPE